MRCVHEYTLVNGEPVSPTAGRWDQNARTGQHLVQAAAGIFGVEELAERRHVQGADLRGRRGVDLNRVGRGRGGSGELPDDEDLSLGVPGAHVERLRV